MFPADLQGFSDQASQSVQVEPDCHLAAGRQLRKNPMKILAIDSSGKIYSAALFDDNRLISECSSEKPNLAGAGGIDSVQTEPKKESLKLRPDATSSLFRLLEKLLDCQGWQFQELEGLAIAQGPGLFTGLRVGVVAAKMLAYSLEIPLVGINTLDAIAWQTLQRISTDPRVKPESELQVLINAQRQQWFVRRYPVPIFNGDLASGGEPDPRRLDSMLASASETEILTADQITQRMADDSLISGPGLNDLQSSLSEHLAKRVPAELWHCSAASIGHLAWIKIQAGEFSDIWKLQPLYYRPSYAEEI